MTISIEKIEKKVISFLEKRNGKTATFKEVKAKIKCKKELLEKAIENLAAKGLITVEEIEHNGKTERRIKICSKIEELMKILSEVKEIPCFVCNDLFSCVEHDRMVVECKKLNRYLLKKAGLI